MNSVKQIGLDILYEGLVMLMARGNRANGIAW